MDCEVAREALSARIDGEREAVPSTRVNEHLSSCVACTNWYRGASEQARLLQTLVGGPARSDEPNRSVHEPAHRRLWTPLFAARCALALAGAVQLGISTAQVLGLDFGLIGHHGGAASGAHLLNESTAWSAALGVAMIAAGFRPVLAAGVAVVAGLYSVGLVFYVAADTLANQVTAQRAASHLPVIAGAALALGVWRASRPQAPTDSVWSSNTDAVLKDSLTDRRRRRQIETNDNSAA